MNTDSTIRLSKWIARRSGSSITISGTGPDGKEVKIPNVRKLYGPTELVPHSRAMDERGRIYQLV